MLQRELKRQVLVKKYAIKRLKLRNSLKKVYLLMKIKNFCRNSKTT